MATRKPKLAVVPKEDLPKFNGVFLNKRTTRPYWTAVWDFRLPSGSRGILHHELGVPSSFSKEEAEEYAKNNQPDWPTPSTQFKAARRGSRGPRSGGGDV